MSVRQALADRTFGRSVRPFPIVEAQQGAGVVAEPKLSDVKVQVLLRAALIHATAT